MKKIIAGITFLTLMAIHVAGAEKELTINSKIKAVTVFVQGAEINRTAKVTLAKGVNKVVFSDLTPYLDRNTIQLGGKGAFTILSVNYRGNYLKNKPKSKALLDAEKKLEELREAKNLNKEQRQVLYEEKKLILANKVLSSEKDAVTADRLRAMADFYRARLTDVAKKILVRNKEDRRLNKEIHRYTKQLNELNQNRNKQIGEIVAEILADAPTTGTLKLSYLTQQAGWVPSYEIRAGQNSKKMNLNFRGSIYQKTGYDWKNIKLKLSTGYPLRNNNKPTIHPWILRFYHRAVRTALSNRAYALEEMEVMEDADMVVKKEYKRKPLGNIIENQLATEYEINVNYNVPSDNKRHIAIIRKLQLPAEYEFYSAPKRDKDAFLVGKITGWDQYSLVPGEANLYFDGTYVGKSYFNTAVTDDTLSISMGRSRGIITDRKRIKDFREKKTFGSNIKETIGVRVKVRNTRKTPIKIEVQDQIPVSGNKEIDVELLESSGASFNKETGILTWKLELAQGQTKDLVFKYSVKYPKSKKINL